MHTMEQTIESSNEARRGLARQKQRHSGGFSRFQLPEYRGNPHPFRHFCGPRNGDTQRELDDCLSAVRGPLQGGT